MLSMSLAEIVLSIIYKEQKLLLSKMNPFETIESIPVRHKVTHGGLNHRLRKSKMYISVVAINTPRTKWVEIVFTVS